MVWNPKVPAWYGSNIGQFLVPGNGSVFYVNSAANGALDANDGLTPELAFLTIDYAIAQCSGTTHDYIFVIAHDDATETYPIEMDVNMVHLIGLESVARPTPRIRVDSDVDAIDLTADYCEIAGLSIDNAADAYNNTLIDLSATASANHIHHNWIAWFFWGYNAMVLATNSDNNLIEHNMFGAHGWANIGINIGGTCGRAVIRDNLFILNGYDTGVRVLQISSVNHCVVENNEFMVPDSAAGEAITVTGDTNLFTGNVVSSGKVALTFNPYRDIGDGVDNCWGLNHAGIAPTFPVTV